METIPVTQESVRDEKGRFRPGVSGNPNGPHSGLKHRASYIKECLFNVFDKWGGQEKLLLWVKESKLNEREFIKMLLSVLPKEMQIDGDGLAQTKIILVNQNSKEQSESNTQRIPAEIHL
jgi:predicted SAM-dependent methyltransferase